MKRSTRKLSGPAKDRFFERFFAQAQDLDKPVADRLAEKSARTFTSVRVRPGELRALYGSPALHQRPSGKKPSPKKSRPATQPAEAEATGALSPEPVAKGLTGPAEADPSSPHEAPGDAGQPAPEPAPPPEDETDFDPFAFGLVPTYQREGDQGLREKLATVGSASNLLLMAKSQQIIIRRELRTLDADPEEIREAIITAVGKRIGDRRSAAG